MGDTRTDMGVVRPSDYASLAADKVDLDNVINELISRLEDHKYGWELYEYGLTDAVERQRVAPSLTTYRQRCTPAGRQC